MVTIICGDKKFEEVEIFCFDKDGTLLTLNMYKPVMKKRAELLLDKYGLKQENYNDLLSLMGLNPETEEIDHKGPIHIERVEIIRRTREYLRTFSINSSIEEIAELFDEVDHLIDFTEYVEAFDGVSSLLNQLRDKGIKLMVSTHDSTEPASKQLASAGLFDYFDLIYGLDIDSPYQAKPAPDMLQYGCKTLEVDISKSIVVGDDDRDLLMGRNAGALACIGVLSGKAEEKDFKHADVIVDSIANIKIK
ncbi:MAG: Phosphoglycolate phosphatase [Candidatus Heimdallarchaeota archaeon AB_125]|nr:MAG: Phosphoglycolate phosphatase [Candidatus Heimdallarchaeota archaeon AB_125]